MSKPKGNPKWTQARLERLEQESRERMESASVATCELESSDFIEDSYPPDTYEASEVEELEETETVPTQGFAKPQDDPSFKAGLLAQTCIEAEQKAKAERIASKSVRRNKHGEVLPEEPARPMKMAYYQRRRKPDGSIWLDPETNEPPKIPKDHTLQWARTEDHHGRHIQSRVNDYRDYGFQEVRNKKGEIVKGPLGLLMHGPIEGKAQRMIDNSHHGVYNREELLEDTREAIREGNNAAGERVASLVKHKSHGSKRVWEGPSEEIIDDDDYERDDD